ncbi:hypothetical protein L1987_58152 [Smallanthus sonchifolius]|uniref:Uncharacterized protein n=1 Tax=Smallanthus sonchifolius TaxID=185202 RepID=A0ACB9DEY3_9ASTR|nr:hypothetical protein L1987_58152 [Smallanthus sonchifolius]
MKLSLSAKVSRSGMLVFWSTGYSSGETINGTDYLESPGKTFQMGFFSLEMESDRRHVGIWYAMDLKTVVWVANREYPLPTDSSGVLTVTDDGNFKVLDKDQKVYFDTKIGGATQNALKLLDSGNAVLIDIVSESIKWQSFLNPTDTFLPGMKMDLNLNLISWKNINDPSSGSFMFKQEETHYAIINNDKSTHHWKSGSGSIKNFDPEPLFIDAYNLLSNYNERANEANHCKSDTNPLYKKLSCTRPANVSFILKNYSRLLMNRTGNIQYFSWAEDYKQWVLDWQVPKDHCGIYGVCGKFSLCSLSNFPTCDCLSGFEPIVPGDTSVGCKRKYDLSCTDSDEFLNMSMIKVENPTPPYLDIKNELDCKKRCLGSCLCVAYSYTPANEKLLRSGRPEGTNSCWIWDSELYTLQANGTRNISIRVSLGSLRYIYYKRLVIPEQGTNSVHQRDNSERWAIELLDPDQSREEDSESIGVPFFQLEGIRAATENFSEANKLGRGGFGSVYKELNPKISDFGLAKIVQGREMEATTNRVVGTYGYMASEYALEGFFSIKSDVFSFGVVVLEIISGKKNTGYPQLRQNLSLLGYAWSLWKEDMPFEVMDQRLVESSNSIEVLKCIIVGLLCVQEDPGDRPSMTNVVLMLAGDIASLPNPKQPAFVARKTLSNSSSSSYKPDQTITMTLPEGRQRKLDVLVKF